MLGEKLPPHDIDAEEAVIGSLLIVFALVTSYWSVSLALADILRERTGISARVAWLLATLLIYQTSIAQSIDQ